MNKLSFLTVHTFWKGAGFKKDEGDVGGEGNEPPPPVYLFLNPRCT